MKRKQAGLFRFIPTVPPANGNVIKSHMKCGSVLCEASTLDADYSMIDNRQSEPCRRTNSRVTHGSFHEVGPHFVTVSVLHLQP